MTMMIEPKGRKDKILAFFGKRRAVYFPEMSNPSAYCVAPREGFFSALIRPKGRPLPKGMVYWDDKEDTESRAGMM